jgi:outer membrane receptor protein involved in Fe transport
LKHSKGELTIGGEWREHTGRHWGELTWSQALPPGTPPNAVFYDYTGRVNVISTFAQESYSLRSDLQAIGSLQWRRTRYAIGDDQFNGYDFNLHYSFLSPRVGLNWNATDRWNAFASYAHTQVEPILSEIYRADDPTSVPMFRVVDVANHIYEDPLIDPETLDRLQAGRGERQGDRLLARLSKRDRPERQDRPVRRPDHGERGAIHTRRDRAGIQRAAPERPGTLRKSHA